MQRFFFFFGRKKNDYPLEALDSEPGFGSVET